MSNIKFIMLALFAFAMFAAAAAEYGDWTTPPYEGVLKPLGELAKNAIEKVYQIHQMALDTMLETRSDSNKARGLSEQPTESKPKERSSDSLACQRFSLSHGEHAFSNSFVFQPNEQEEEMKQLNVRYICTTDLYERYIRDGSNNCVINTYKTWQSAKFSSKNIKRKVEHDHKMVYLAREVEDDTMDYAEIVWKFDFKSVGLKVKSYKLVFVKKTFGEGQVDVDIERLDTAAAAGTSSADIIGANEFQIKAKLSGGIGPVAWQHTQLFRQKHDSKDYPFDIQIKLE